MVVGRPIIMKNRVDILETGKHLIVNLEIMVVMG